MEPGDDASIGGDSASVARAGALSFGALVGVVAVRSHPACIPRTGAAAMQVFTILFRVCFFMVCRSALWGRSPNARFSIPTSYHPRPRPDRFRSAENPTRTARTFASLQRTVDRRVIRRL